MSNKNVATADVRWRRVDVSPGLKPTVACYARWIAGAKGRHRLYPKITPAIRLLGGDRGAPSFRDRQSTDVVRSAQSCTDIREQMPRRQWRGKEVCLSALATPNLARAHFSHGAVTEYVEHDVDLGLTIKNQYEPSVAHRLNGPRSLKGVGLT